MDINGVKKFYDIKDAWETSIGKDEIKKRFKVLNDLLYNTKN